MDQSKLQTSLSKREHEELRANLASHPGAMSLVRTDGFLACLASAPTLLPPSAWFPRVLGDTPYESLEQAEQTYGLLIRRYNQIVMELDDARGIHPRRSLNRDELTEWCDGFLAASHLDPIWKNDKTAVSLLLPFAVLTGGFNLVGQVDTDGSVIEDATQHEEKYLRELPQYVLSIHHYWTERGRNEMKASTLSSSTELHPPKIGRNEPCPCGSGRKYKRCCAVQ